MNCLYCGNYIRAGKGVGTGSDYCKIECWFQDAAAEYKRAYDALMAIEHGGDGVDVLAQISNEVIAEYGDPFAEPEQGTVDPYAENPNEGESFDAFMLRTVYEPAWARGEYPDLGDM